MDHAGMEMDRVDLERYRNGQPPLKRTWHKAFLVTPKTVVDESLDTLQKILYPKQRRVK